MPDEAIGTTPGGTPAGTVGQEPAVETTVTFEAWLEKQPAEAKTLYEAHTSGLKSALQKERDARKRQTDEIGAAEAKRRQAELSEVEQLKAKIAESEKAKADAEARVNDALIRHAVEMAANKLKFHRPEVAYQLLDLAEVSIDEDGKVSGVDEALKKLVKENAYLVNTGAEALQQETDASKRGQGKPDPKAKQEELRRRYRLPA
jgi:predicted KAP-like P-loop ATPase